MRKNRKAYILMVLLIPATAVLASKAMQLVTLPVLIRF